MHSLFEFFRRPVGGELFCRLYRASHCRSCAAHHLQTPTFLDIVNDPSFRSFLEELFDACKLSDIIGSLDPYSRNLERIQLVSDSTPPLSLAVRCNISCQFRMVIDKIATAFFTVRFFVGHRRRVALSGSDIDWRGLVAPIFSMSGLRFADVFRHPHFCSLVASIGSEPHGYDGAVDCYVGPTFLHYMAWCCTDDEESHLVAIRAFDEADKQSLPSPATVPFSQSRDPSCGSAAYYYWKRVGVSSNTSSEAFAESSPVFRYLLTSYRSGPMFRHDVEDDVGAPTTA